MTPRLATALSRAGLVLLGLLLFAAVEGVLALLGLGGARDRPDPLLGFTREYHVFVPDPAKPGVLVTDPAKRESFNAQAFEARKPAGTVRVFCLGGSDTYGFPRGAAEAYPAFLGAKLARAFPERRVEVVNVGGLSYAAYRCVNVAREIARYEPDAIVYHGGNNEYVERRFFAKILAEPAWRRALRARLSRLRTYTLLEKALARPPKPGASPEGAGGLFGVRVLRDDNEPLPRSEAEDRAIEENFRAALSQMAAIAREAGALFVLGVPAVNQADWPPDLSLHDASLDADALAAFGARLADGRRLLESGDAAGAARALAPAVASDPRHAEAHYLLARCYHALGETDKAIAEYDAASATDGTPIRATPRLQAAAREVGAREKATVVDVAALFARLSRDEGGAVGRRLMLDYCHPTREGHERIADALFAALAGPLFGAPGAEAPPLEEIAGAAGGSAFGIAWEGQMLVRQGRFREAAAKFEEALAVDPEFAYALEGLGRCHAEWGDTTRALDYYERAARANPPNPTILTNLANVYLSTGRPAEAEAALRKAISIDAVGSTNARVLLARALVQMGRRDAARAALEEAIAANPNRAEAHRLLGSLLDEAGDFAGAEARYREALRLDPDDRRLAYAHAFALGKLGRYDEALAAFEALVARHPDFYEAVGAIGVLRLQRGERDRAAECFRKVLDLHPGDALARRYLDAIEGRAPLPTGPGASGSR